MVPKLPPKLRAISPRYNKKRWRHFLSQDREGILHIEGVSVRDLQKKYGTPLYVFVEEDIRKRFRAFKQAFTYPKFLPQYPCKVNANLEVLKIAREEGFEFDASSIGEIILGLLADFEPEQITFTNLYKTEQDIFFAATVGVKAITVDSLEELEKVVTVAGKQRKEVPIMLRVNPMIQEGRFTTKTQKYGIPHPYMKRAVDRALEAPYIKLRGFHFHGSYAHSPKGYYLAAKKVMKLAAYAKSKGAIIDMMDFGGGFPSEAPKVYHPGKYFGPEEFAPGFEKYFTKLCKKHGIEDPILILEPGKSMVATAGVGIIKVVSVKDFGKKDCVVTDSSTYSMFPDVLVSRASYDILPATDMNLRRTEKYEIVGATCDCIDVIEDYEKLPKLEAGDLLAVMDCGAYSYVMASNFNNLKRPPIVLIKADGTTKLIRRRDRYSDLFDQELDVLKMADPNELKKYYDLTRINLDKLWRGTGAESNGKKGSDIK